MEFREIAEKEKEKWNRFILENSPESFLQSFEWGRFQKAAGRNVFRFIVCEGGDIFAVASVVEHKLPFGLKYWYVPRGPVLQVNADKNQKREAYDFLISGLRKEARKRSILFVRMDPAQAKDRRKVLERAGFKPVAGSVQPKDTLVLDLQKSEEEILSGMKQKTRYNIRLAEKKSVSIFYEKIGQENFEEFWSLMQATSERDGIVSHDKEYYRKMLETLDDEGNTLKARLYFAKIDGRVIAANILLLFGDYAVYLHGASSNEFRNLMAPYLLQWRQIQDVKNAGCRTYDFWGITVANENPKWEGITRFKTGFGGKEISYAGVFDLPVNKLLYELYMRARKL